MRKLILTFTTPEFSSSQAGPHAQALISGTLDHELAQNDGMEVLLGPLGTVFLKWNSSQVGLPIVLDVWRRAWTRTDTLPYRRNEKHPLRRQNSPKRRTDAFGRPQIRL